MLLRGYGSGLIMIVIISYVRSVSTHTPDERYAAKHQGRNAANVGNQYTGCCSTGSEAWRILGQSWRGRWCELS